MWVVDLRDEPTVYYDAPPSVARALLQGPPLTFVRAGEITSGCADARLADALPPERLDELFALLDAKYGALDGATELFYTVLGSRRDRVGVVLQVDDCP